MFETSFSHTSATPMPPNLSIDNAVTLLHDFETVIKLGPDCRGCKPVEPKNGQAKTNGTTTSADIQHFEVEDDLPFIPKKLWSGGVKYRADFVPMADGCDITVYAPGGFTSTNHWRLIRGKDSLERGSKDMLHADSSGSGWFVQLVSDASCNKTYAGFVKGFLGNAHSQLQQSFIDKLKQTPQQQQQKQQQQQRRPTMARRRSSVL